MTPLIGLRSKNTLDSQGAFLEIRPCAAGAGAAIAAQTSEGSSRAADYAYRIATVTAGLVLLATVM